MDPENLDHESRQLRALLAWKRHEQPPPGFFMTFSSGVITELESCHETPVSWWEGLQAKMAGPVLACSYGAALGAALVIGIGFSDPQDSSTTLQAGSLSRSGSLWTESGNPRIPNLESGDYPALFGPAETFHSKPIIRSGPVSFLMEHSPSVVEKASFQFR